jgi:hypothetical protein
MYENSFPSLKQMARGIVCGRKRKDFETRSITAAYTHYSYQSFTIQLFTNHSNHNHVE